MSNLASLGYTDGADATFNADLQALSSGSTWYADAAYQVAEDGQRQKVYDFIMALPEHDRMAFYCYKYG